MAGSGITNLMKTKVERVSLLFLQSQNQAAYLTRGIGSSVNTTPVPIMSSVDMCEGKVREQGVDGNGNLHDAHHAG